MKIGVIGASGKAGALIAAEAKNRGHEVTAIVRDRKKVEGKDYRVIEKSLFDLNAGDLKDLEVIISAFGTPFDGSADAQHIDAAEHLIKVFGELPKARIIVIGGAASLYTDRDNKVQALESIPEAWRGVPRAAAKALELFKQSTINWTFFSPALTFDATKEGDGSYALGTDYVINNKSGQSYLTYKDAALALVDEAERGWHVQKRFTAVSTLTPGVADTEYYGPLKKKPDFGGYAMSRFRQPFNYELAGKNFKLIMDYDTDYSLEFLSGHELKWGPYGQANPQYYYEAAKADETTYFVNFEIPDSDPRTCITVILDLEQRLVTQVKSLTKFSKKYPNMVNSSYDFGALDIPGFPLPRLRHGYTADLIGKRIRWNYQVGFSIIHVYYHPNYIRATFPPELVDRILPGPEAQENWNRGTYDERTTYIKIKKNIYVVELSEQNMTKGGWTGNSLLFLMNLERVHDVGRSYGYHWDEKKPGVPQPENYLFGAHGEFVDSDGKIEGQQSLYRV